MGGGFMAVIPAPRVIKVKHLMMLVVAAALCMAVLRPVLLVVDAIGHGPYSTWYNARCHRLATEAGLVGKPEKEVEKVLGKADFVWVYDRPDRSRTYNYAPSVFSGGKFQVHCKNGIVDNLEQLDD
jgi:hypothetical protein